MVRPVVEPQPDGCDDHLGKNKPYGRIAQPATKPRTPEKRWNASMLKRADGAQGRRDNIERKTCFARERGRQPPCGKKEACSQKEAAPNAKRGVMVSPPGHESWIKANSEQNESAGLC